MAKTSRPTAQKRAKERARQEKQQQKEARRLESKERKASSGLKNGEDRGNSSRAATVARRVGPNVGNRRREELDHYPSLIEVPKQHFLRSVPSDRAIFESQDRRTRESCALDVRFTDRPKSP